MGRPNVDLKNKKKIPTHLISPSISKKKVCIITITMFWV